MDTMEVLYKVKGESAYDVMYQVSAHNVQMAPDSLKHRYVTEDIPYGLGHHRLNRKTDRCAHPAD
jgi:opine dehydrogenase